MTVICFILQPSSFILAFSPPRTGLEPVPTPRQGAMRTLTPTRLSHLNPTNTGRARESNPGRDIHSVVCCHYTKLAIDTRSSGRGGARTLTARFAGGHV